MSHSEILSCVVRNLANQTIDSWKWLTFPALVMFSQAYLDAEILKWKFRNDLLPWCSIIVSWFVSACRVPFWSSHEPGCYKAPRSQVQTSDVTPPHKGFLRGQDAVFHVEVTSFREMPVLIGFPNLLSFSGLAIPYHISRRSNSWEKSNSNIISFCFYFLKMVFYVHVRKDITSCVGQSILKNFLYS